MRSLVTAALLGAALAGVRPLQSQPPRLSAPAQLLGEPGGRAIALLRSGAPVATRATSGAFTQVAVEGYLDASLVGGARDSFAISVRARSGAMLRAAGAPGAEVLAELRDGMGLSRVSRTGRWVRVRRVGWVATGALGRPAQVAQAPRATATAPAPRVATPAGGEARKPTFDDAADTATPSSSATDTDTPETPASRLAAARRVSVRTSPEGSTLLTAEPGATMTPLSRERGWVRVRVEGWVREGDVVPADTSLRADLSAADLRADPEGNRGRIVRWDVAVLALQTADPLRKDLARDEPYLLARGPGSENAVLYLAVPPSLMSVARALPPLARVTVVARVRVARSEPVGVPVLDLQSITRR